MSYFYISQCWQRRCPQNHEKVHQFCNSAEKWIWADIRVQISDNNLYLCFRCCIFRPFSCCFPPPKQQCLTGDGTIPEFKDKQIAGDRYYPALIRNRMNLGIFLHHCRPHGISSTLTEHLNLLFSLAEKSQAGTVVSNLETSRLPVRSTVQGAEGCCISQSRVWDLSDSTLEKLLCLQGFICSLVTKLLRNFGQIT